MTKNNTSSLTKIEQSFRELIIERCKFCDFDKYLAENPDFAFPKLSEEMIGSQELNFIAIPGLFGGFAYYLGNISDEITLYAEQSSRMDHDADDATYFEIREDSSRLLRGQERRVVQKKFYELAKKAHENHIAKLNNTKTNGKEDKMHDIEKLRSETIARLKTKGWDDAVRIVTKFDDQIDIKAAYEWSEHIGGDLTQAGYIRAITD